MTSNITTQAHHGAQRWNLALRTLQLQISQRTGFWRALLEMLIVTNVFGMVPYLLGKLVGSPWVELVSFAIYPLIIYTAWRLAPGSGGLLRRIVRVLLWCTLYAVIGGAIGWGLTELFPYDKPLYSMRPESFRIPLPLYLLNMIIITYSLVLPARMLLTLWSAARRRLRWLLTFSYLVVGVVTTAIVPVIYGLFLGVSSLNSAPIFAPLDKTAERLVQGLAPTVDSGIAPDELNRLLADLLAGRAQLPIAPEQAGEEVRQFENLTGVKRLTLVGPDGLVVASAGNEPFSVQLPLPEDVRLRWRLTLDQAPTGGCILARPVDGPLPEAAACRLGSEGSAQPVLIVENRVDAQTQWGAALGRIIGLVLLGTSFSLTLALPIVALVLLVALGIGVLIARRIAQRLELLAQATGDIAAGNLSRRVEVDREDEIGQLSADFNLMAQRLEERERALAAEAARAEAALEANKRLVANVSHELRTPLTTLRGYVEALEQEHSKALPAHDLTVIQGEIQRLTSMIEDLFTLARAEAQQLPLTVETIDAAVLIEKLVATLAPLARRDRQIELVSALPADLPLVRADRNRLDQVFLNLAQNALRHTPPGGIIAFEATADARCVHVTVADTGMGIAEEEQELVFERFYRGDQSRARETGGAGLGLALVRELVTAMDGTIAVESTPGRGSRFTVSLRRG